MKHLTIILSSFAFLLSSMLRADTEEHVEDQHEDHETHEHLENHEEGDLEEALYQQNLQLEMKRQELDFESERRLRELEVERQELELQNMYHDRDDEEEWFELIGLLLIISLTLRILLAVWVHLDCRKRQTGSGLWIFIILLGGLLATIAYGIMRMGDLRAASPAKTTTSRKN